MDLITENNGKIRWVSAGILVVERPFYGAEKALIEQRDTACAELAASQAREVVLREAITKHKKACTTGDGWLMYYDYPLHAVLDQVHDTCAPPVMCKPTTLDNDLHAHLDALVSALDKAFISSWQSAHYWQQELDAAREFLNNHPK